MLDASGFPPCRKASDCAERVLRDHLWEEAPAVIEATGFEFVDFSTLHYRYDDELRYEVGRRTVSGNTDRFTLLFKKP